MVKFTASKRKQRKVPPAASRLQPCMRGKGAFFLTSEEFGTDSCMSVWTVGSLWLCREKQEGNEGVFSSPVKFLEA
jgi:hypothetical protein